VLVMCLEMSVQMAEKHVSAGYVPEYICPND
jgi:hypothetical protein